MYLKYLYLVRPTAFDMSKAMVIFGQKQSSTKMYVERMDSMIRCRGNTDKEWGHSLKFVQNSFRLMSRGLKLCSMS
jgi:hypothetical protein